MRRRWEPDSLDNFALFWYLTVMVIEFRYHHHQLLPHLGCVLNNEDNICDLRPPRPAFLYNLLHQKLTLLNCCIEEQRNNAAAEQAEDKSQPSASNETPKDETPSETPVEPPPAPAAPRLAGTQDETPLDETPPVPIQEAAGSGILSWTGWFLAGTAIPAWIPVTRDKSILTVCLGAQRQLRRTRCWRSSRCWSSRVLR